MYFVKKLSVKCNTAKLFVNDHKQELLKTDRKYHLFKFVQTSSLLKLQISLPFTELVLLFVSIPKQQN